MKNAIKGSLKSRIKGGMILKEIEIILKEALYRR